MRSIIARTGRGRAAALGVATAASLLSVSVTGNHAAALSCAQPPRPAEAIDELAAVLEVRATTRRVLGRQAVEVEKVYAGGTLPETVFVDGGTSPWARELPVGKVVPIAAHSIDGRVLRIGPCPAARGGAAALVEYLRGKGG